MSKTKQSTTPVFEARQTNTVRYSFNGGNPTPEQVEAVIADAREKGFSHASMLFSDDLISPSIVFSWRGIEWKK